MGASGTASLNFGAFPGVRDVTLDVATAGVISTSLIEAWILPAATTEHSIDEHRIENLRVSATWKVNGTITIFGVCTDPPVGGQTPGKLYGNYNIGWVWV